MEEIPAGDRRIAGSNSRCARQVRIDPEKSPARRAQGLTNGPCLRQSRPQSPPLAPFRLNDALHPAAALDRARHKAYWRLLPLVFVCYLIAYIDRSNVSIAKLTMSVSLPEFNEAVIGIGSGIFYFGYGLLEIPGAVFVERWSARQWICRIMITWGIIAALTSAVRTPEQFYIVRFFLGLAEAGFFPGVIVYLTHWFPRRDRARALAFFVIAQPVSQIVSLKITNAIIKIGTTEKINGALVHHAKLFGLEGWQWVYIFWGVPAVILGVVVWFTLTDWPRDAKWLTVEEKSALETELLREKNLHSQPKNRNLLTAFKNPKIILLTLAYFCSVSASLGLELFMPSILKDWYKLDINNVTWLVMLPPALGLAGMLFVGWNSDRTKERRLHVILPVAISLVALALAPRTQGTGALNLYLTMICFMLAAAGLKAYQPAFWSLPHMVLTESAAAGAIGLINSFGNLGGFYGQAMLGNVKELTGSYVNGLYLLCGSLAIFIVIILSLGLGRRDKTA